MGNFFDNGTHTIGPVGYFNDEHQVAGMDQLGYTKEHIPTASAP